MSTDPQAVPGADAQPPTCYRHPDRETYVRCTRCDRPICPDCMREAAVGHQCVECVREGNRSVRSARTIFGGRPQTTAVVTYTLLAINLAMYAVEVVYPGIIDRLGGLGIGLQAADGNTYVYPGQPVQGYETVGIAEGEWYRLITSAFLHSPPSGGGFGFSHILFNMWALWMLGPQLELVLGRVRFLTLYLVSALGGSVLAYAVAPEQSGIGASGAIFGLFAAFFVISKRMRTDTKGIVILLVLNLVITFSVPGISWQAHIGGLITGLVLAAVYAYAPARNRAVVHSLAAVVVVAVLITVVVVRTAALTATI